MEFLAGALENATALIGRLLCCAGLLHSETGCETADDVRLSRSRRDVFLQDTVDLCECKYDDREKASPTVARIDPTGSNGDVVNAETSLSCSFGRGSNVVRDVGNGSAD